MKVLTVVGARPQFVKAAVISRAFKVLSDEQTEPIEEKIIHTGQHYDEQMSDVFFDEMSIPRPAFQLAYGGLSHGAMTGRMIEEIERIVLSEKPDWVLVYGDTNSTLAGALAAVKVHVPVAHVEAGLRSFNRAMPEEINRVLTDHASSLLFAPTERSRDTLLKEGLSDSMIMVSGDVMYDAALYYASLSNDRSGVLAQLGLTNCPYILSTIHRAENTDDPEKLRVIVDSLIELSRDLPVVLPLHPRTRKSIDLLGIDTVAEGLLIVAPLGYLDMVSVEKHAKLTITDSGGVQKESFFYSVPCLTLRNETEWVELVELGVNEIVCPLNVETVVQRAKDLLLSGSQMDFSARPYGDGQAGIKIARRLQSR